MQKHLGWGHLCAIIAAFAVAWALALILVPTSDAATPYGGCKEAYTAPHSAAADQCRETGWTIAVRPSGHGIIVSPHHVIRYLWLPQCRNEDGSGQRSACTWNVTLPYQGDGRGRALWIDWHDRTHYVKRTIAQQHLQD